MIGERLFAVFDTDGDNYLSKKEFVESMLQFYSTDFSLKLKLIFSLYSPISNL
ncbi:MAG: hypothetical protein P4M11_10655 [Candidatus Pacebacteria bacterium]|nr:hypothetical protein [Candidatus Paceibacterota bacterium]